MLSPFIHKARKSAVPQPTQRRFTLKKWEQAFNSATPHSEADEAVYEIGKWVFGRLENIRQQIAQLPLGNIPLKGLPKYICGALNLTAKDLSQKHVDFASQGFYFAEQFIQAKLPRSKISAPASPDEVLTQTVDGARYPLAHALSSTLEDHPRSDDEVDLALIQTLMLFGEYYDIVEGIWLHALWHGLRMTKAPAAIVFSPEDPEHDENHAVSVYRRQTLQYQAIQFCIGFWKQTPLAQRGANVRSLPRVLITGSGKSRKLSIHHSDEDCDSPPISTILRVVWQDEYLDPLMTQTMPRLPTLTLENLLSAWQTLRSLAEVTLSRYPIPKERLCRFGEMLPYATVYRESELVSLLRESLGVPLATAKQILSLLRFDPDPRCELWSHPLVEVSPGRYTLVVAPLLYGNVLRCVEHWMRIGGLDLSSRGPAFERQVRKQVAEGCQESILSASAYVHPSSFSLKVDTQEEEIDMVLAVGCCIVIAELKCQVFPSEALDYHDYYETLQGAAEQAKRKAAFVREHLEEFITRINMQYSLAVSETVVVPCVITNQPIGVGFPVDSVAVADLPIILRYLDGKWEQFVLFDGRGNKSQVGKTTRFYGNPDEAGRRLADYLLDPPQIRFFRNFVEVRELPCPPLSANELPFVTLTTQVRLPVGDREYKNAQQTPAGDVLKATPEE